MQQSFKPRSERAATEVENAVTTLVEQALADTSLVKGEVLDTIEEMIARLDEKLTVQVNAIIHSEEFQQIESAWRGLNYVVFNSETDTTLKIRVMNVSQEGALQAICASIRARGGIRARCSSRSTRPSSASWVASRIGCLIGDYYFSHLPTDVQLLRDLGKIARRRTRRSSPAPIRRCTGMDSWTELSNPRDHRQGLRHAGICGVEGPARSGRLALRRLVHAARAVARCPTARSRSRSRSSPSRKRPTGIPATSYGWMNAAYAMAANINRAFKEYGWTTRIRGVQSGGEVINLPTHTFPTDDGGVDLKCPTEIAISDRREAELAKAGLIPIVHRKNTDKAAFIGAQSLFSRGPSLERKGSDATASDNLSAPASLHVRRVAVCPLSEVHGPRQDRLHEGEGRADGLAADVGQSEHVDAESVDVLGGGQGQKAALGRQGRGGSENVENPGYYQAKIFLRPHYQLEGMDIGLSLVSRIDREARRLAATRLIFLGLSARKCALLTNAGRCFGRRASFVQMGGIEMAVDIFLKMLPIKGESVDAKHKDEMQLLAWSWGMSQSGTTHEGNGRRRWKGLGAGSQPDQIPRCGLTAAAAGVRDRPAFRRSDPGRAEGRRQGSAGVSEAQARGDPGHRGNHRRQRGRGSADRKRIPELPQIHDDLHLTVGAGCGGDAGRFHLRYRGQPRGRRREGRIVAGAQGWRGGAPPEPDRRGPSRGSQSGRTRRAGGQPAEAESSQPAADACLSGGARARATPRSISTTATRRASES